MFKGRSREWLVAAFVAVVCGGAVVTAVSARVDGERLEALEAQRDSLETVVLRVEGERDALADSLLACRERPAPEPVVEIRRMPVEVEDTAATRRAVEVVRDSLTAHLIEMDMRHEREREEWERQRLLTALTTDSMMTAAERERRDIAAALEISRQQIALQAAEPEPSTSWWERGAFFVLGAATVQGAHWIWSDDDVRYVTEYVTEYVPQPCKKKGH